MARIESKALKDSKSSHQNMMDEQTAEIQGLKADLKKLQAENEKLNPAFKETQERELYEAGEKTCVS